MNLKKCKRADKQCRPFVFLLKRTIYNINEENSAEDDGISDSAEQANEPTEGQISFELDGSEG
mgnify:CR=1 FL=1